MTSQADVQRVVDLIDHEVSAVSDGDAEAYFAILADDAVFMAPNQPLRSGGELRNWLRDFLETFSIEWLEFEHIDTEIDSDLAYHTYAYRWRITPRAGGEPRVAQGKGLHVLRRQDDGAWKIIREIWNTSPDVAAGP